MLSRATFGIDRPGQRRSEQLAMFRISSRSCNTFTFAEILIMAAMNVENVRFVSAGRLRANPAIAQKK